MRAIGAAPELHAPGTGVPCTGAVRPAQIVVVNREADTGCIAALARGRPRRSATMPLSGG